MTSISYPSPTYNGGSLTDLEFERLVTNQTPDGLIGFPSDPARVYADGTGTRRVNLVANRRALVRGFLYDSGPTDIALTHAANTSGVTRIDLIVLRLDRSTWRVTEAIKQGTPGAGPPAATGDTGSTGVWELPLATVSIPHNATTLSAGNVTQIAWYIGEDGNILCTSSTRPPASPGRVIHETDTDITWESPGFGEPWRVLRHPIQPGLIARKVRTVNSPTNTTDEVITDTITFTPPGGRDYELTWKGLYSSTVAGDFLIIRFRHKAGATLDDEGTQFQSQVVPVFAANVGHPITLVETLTGLPGGVQTTVGVTIVRTVGSGLIASGADSFAQNVLILKDIGPSA